MFFHMVYKSGLIFLPFCHNSRVWRTDRQTDGQTDRILIARPRLHYMQRGKNGKNRWPHIRKSYPKPNKLTCCCSSPKKSDNIQEILITGKLIAYRHSSKTIGLYRFTIANVQLKILFIGYRHPVL